MQTKKVMMFGQLATLVCDANCGKAWGFSKRPKVSFDPACDDDIAYLADDELGFAPGDPGTYEGGCAKPTSPTLMNRWCSRQCERCDVVRPGQEPEPRSFAVRLFNQPWKHEPSNVGNKRPGRGPLD
jgi:hypothetical protein